MGVLEKYKLLSTGKAFGNRAQIALALLDSKTAYEELKEEAAQSMVLEVIAVKVVTQV